MEISRRGLLRLAGATGAAAVIGTALGVATASPANASQSNWTWCHQCQGLWFPGNPVASSCPASPFGGHSLSGSGFYILPTQSDWTGVGQLGWSWCHQCQGLWFSGNGTRGACPAGRGHDNTGSNNYGPNVNSGGGQQNWRWCSLCQGMWFAGNNTAGWCPSFNGPQGHVLTGSGNYHIDQE
jgi:hypothetical protein